MLTALNLTPRDRFTQNITVSRSKRVGIHKLQCPATGLHPSTGDQDLLQCKYSCI